MELLQDLAEFLKIDIKQENSVDTVFLVTLKYLDKLKAKDFEYELLIPLRGVLNKFVNCANFHGIENNDLTHATNDFIDTVNQTTYRPVEQEGGFIDIFGRSKNKNIITKANAPIYQKFQNLYNALIATYNLVKDGKPKSRDLDLEGFYDPNHANKIKSKKILMVAREQLERSIALADKSKKSLTDFLTKATMEFDKPNSNWTLIFGRLKEVLTVLKALESLSNSIKGASTLTLARRSIEDAIQVIDQTSININYKTMNHIFNIDEGSLLIESADPTVSIEPNNNMIETPFETIVEDETSSEELITEVKATATSTVRATETTESESDIEPETIIIGAETVEVELEPEGELSEALKKPPRGRSKKGSSAAKTKTTKNSTSKNRKKKTD